MRLLYFARFRDLLGQGEERLPDHQPLPPDLTALITLLAARGGAWAEVFGGDTKVMVAVNQEMVSVDTALQPEDEVAFFPPVTGG